MTRSATLSFALFALVALQAAPAAAQGARPGAGYVAHALTGGVPVGAVRGRYPGTTTDILFVVNHPAPDSTAFSAFVGGQLVRRFAIAIGTDRARFLDADIPVPGAGEPAPSRSFVAFTFDMSDAAYNALWDYDADRWTVVARYKADGSLGADGDWEWFGAALVESQNPAGGPEGELPARVWKQDSRRLPASGTTSLRIERKSYREVPDVYYAVGVYNGDVGPVQTMNGITRTTPSSIDDASAGACSGLPAVRDINGDGHADFWLCDSESSDGYQTGTYRLYDPEAGLFVKDLAFTFQGSHTFDAARRMVYESRSSGAGEYQTQSEYSLAFGAPSLVRQRRREPENPSCAGGPSCRARFTTRVVEGSTMRVTETRLGRADEYLPAGFGTDASGSE